MGKLKLSLTVDFFAQVPNKESSCLKADSVQMQNLPRCPPGASFIRLSLLTLIKVIPGMLRKALVMP